MNRPPNAPENQSAHLACIVERAYDAIFSVNEGLITSWNRGAKRLYGHTAQEAVGQRFISLLWPSLVAEEATHLYERLSEEESVIDIETDHVRKDGVHIPVSVTLSLLTDAAGASLGAVVTVRGIAEAHQTQELWDEMTEIEAFARHAVLHEEGLEILNLRLEKLEVIDGNTGLSNRRTLDLTLDGECRRAARYCMPLSLLMLYIDDLSHYRETHGILTGETILRRVALLLHEEARTTDLVARYEDELFCIVLPHTDREGAMMAAERIQKRIAAFYGLEDPVTISIGASTFSHAMENGGALVAEAEQALSDAKQKGCNRAVHYEETQHFVRFQTRGVATHAGDSTSGEPSTQAVIRVGDAASLNISRKELAHAYDTTIEGWSRVLDLRDKETEGHSERVMEMSMCLAGVMGVSGQEMVYLRWGALLHDIGKIGVPDSILLKPEPLTPEEWDVMRSHPTLAYEVLGSIEFLQPALDIPFSHHERWDGTGYPQGLQGEEIPLAARIFAIVDVWDALRSDRPYRNAWSERDALDYIYSLAGKHFDPMVVRAFHRMMQANDIGNEREPVFCAA